MANDIKKVNGKITLNEKQFNRMIEKEVMKNNKTSGKITLPKSLINKKVLVVFDDKSIN